MDSKVQTMKNEKQLSSYFSFVGTMIPELSHYPSSENLQIYFTHGKHSAKYPYVLDSQREDLRSPLT